MWNLANWPVKFEKNLPQKTAVPYIGHAKMNHNVQMGTSSFSWTDGTVVDRCVTSPLVACKDHEGTHRVLDPLHVHACRSPCAAATHYTLHESMERGQLSAHTQNSKKSKVDNLYSNSKRNNLIAITIAAELLLQYSPCSLDFMPWLPQTARWHESPRKVPTYTAW